MFSSETSWPSPETSATIEPSLEIDCSSIEFVRRSSSVINSSFNLSVRYGWMEPAMRLRPGESGRFDARLPDGLASSARASVRGWGGRRPRRGVSLSISLLLRYMIDTGGRVGASNASIQVLESTHMSHPGGEAYLSAAAYSLCARIPCRRAWLRRRVRWRAKVLIYRGIEVSSCPGST
jgi:hypothetical protein